jgi:hypothetical protein
MKSIRKIAGKVTALAVAITTSVALLSPYDANATSGISVGGGSAKCGWLPSSATCQKKVTTTNAGGGSGQFTWPWSGGGSGNKTSTTTIETMYKSICPPGAGRTCDFSDPCNNVYTSYACNPDCSIKVK